MRFRNELSQELKQFQTPHSGSIEVSNLYRRHKPTISRRKGVKTKELDYVPSSYPSMTIISMEDFERSYIKTFNEFKKSLATNKEVFEGFSDSFIISLFKKVYLKLVDMDLSNIIFNITKDSSIFFKSSHSSGKIFLELFFDDEISDNHELIINFHKEDGTSLAFGGNIDETLDRLDYELTSTTSEERLQYEQTSIDEELSGLSFTEATL